MRAGRDEQPGDRDQEARDRVPAVHVDAEHELRGGGVADREVRVDDQPGNAPDETTSDPSDRRPLDGGERPLGEQPVEGVSDLVAISLLRS